MNPAEAKLVRRICTGFVEMESATRLAQAPIRERTTTKRGKPFDKNDVYSVLSNRVYLGEAAHKGTAYPGDHKAIVSREQWDAVHAALRAYRSTLALTGMRAGLPVGYGSRLRAKSITYQPTDHLPTDQWFGRLV